MLAPFEKPIAMTRDAIEAGSAPPPRSTKSASSPARTLQVLDVEDAFGEPPEEARHAVLEHLARAGSGASAPGASPPSGSMSFSSPPVPCSSSSVGAPGLWAGLKTCDEAEIAASRRLL